MADETPTRPCPECGETIPADAEVCRFCGTDVAPLADVTPAGVVVSEPAQVAGARWGMIAVTLVIVILVVTLAVVLLSG